jgi:transposase
MASDGLFGELPQQAKPQSDAGPLGSPRLREPKRDQIELRAVDIESLIGEDHPVRVIWAYVEGLDLSELENRIKARGEEPGRAATSPRLLLALWLYAASDGVGSARALERMCSSHDVYRWLCGGVSVNYHTLADFRVGCADLLDRLLSEHLAALAEAGLVDLDMLAQDGVRIRASGVQLVPARGDARSASGDGAGGGGGTQARGRHAFGCQQSAHRGCQAAGGARAQRAGEGGADSAC